jgi:ubiquinone/menaquinone biosynthesis C-methylase UbiE
MARASQSRLLALSAPLLLAWAPGRLPAQDAGAPAELNRPFQAPDVAGFAARFETESREVFANRDAIVASLGLKPGMAVADVGAGTGAFTLPIARAVGASGTVFAADISPEFVRHIAERTEKDGLANVVPVVCTQRSARLPARSVDLVFLCDTYHHFEHPADSLASIRKALRPGGSLVLIEFDRHDGASDFIKNHVRATPAEISREIEAAGLQRVETPPIPGLKENFVARFRLADSANGDTGR